MHRRIRQHDHLRPRRRRRLARGLRVGVRLVQSAIAMAVAMAALLTVVALVASVRPVPLGSVVSALVAGHLDQRLAARSLAVQLGGLEVSFRSALVPVISARDIELRRLGSTAPLVTLSDAEIVLHRGSLALGRLAPKALRLTGLSVSAVSEGAALALDLGQAPVIPAVKTPGELIAALQRIFEQPGLAQIEEIGLAGIALRLEDRANGWVWHSRSGDLRISRSQQRLQVDLALSDLGDGDVPGSLSARLAADLSRDSGVLRLAGRGLNPAQLLPSEGARIAVAASNMDAPVSFDLVADILADGRLGPLGGDFSVGGGEMPLPGGRRLILDALSGQIDVPAGQQVARLEALHLRSNLASFDGSARLLASETPLGVLRGATLQVLLNDLDLAPGLGLKHGLRARYLDAMVQFDRPSFGLRLGPSYLVTAQNETIGLSGYLVPPPSDPEDGAPVMQRIALRPAAGGEDHQSRQMLPDGWRAGLDLSAAALSAETAFRFWPQSVVPNTRSWVLRNVFSGQISDARLSLRLAQTGKPQVGLTFRFDEASLWAMPRLPAFEDGQGFFSLQERRLAVQIAGASLPLPGGARIGLKDALVVKSDTAIDDTPLEISGHGAAAATDVLQMLSLPLFRSGDDQPQALPVMPQQVEGAVSLDLTLRVPMGPDRDRERVEFSGQGHLSDLATTALLSGRDLQSPGLLVDLTQDRVRLSGPVTLDGLPAEAAWEKPLGPGATGSSLRVEAPLSQPLAAAFGVPLQSAQMQGAGQVTAEVALPAGQPPALSLRADLRGAAIEVPSLGWRKSAAQAGTLSLSGRLGATPNFDQLRLQTPGMLAEGSLRIAASGALAGLDLSRLRAGDWIDAPLQLRPGGAGRFDVTLRGGSVDVRNLPKTSGSGGGTGSGNPLGTARLNGTRIVVSDSLALSAVSGSLDLQRAGAGDLRGRVNGKTPVSVELRAVQSGTRIRIRAEDAGAAARDAGVFAQGAGGTLRLTLTPTGPAGQYAGELRVRDITITEAPTATSLLSAISLVGLAEQIGTGGLHFGRVDAAFLLTPDAVVVSEGSATGPSLGLSLDGKLNLKAKTMDMQGVLSPFYFVNRLGSGLTRRGEGLLGFTFRLSGPFANPAVSANPLSILAPGMLRNIFRDEAPK